MFKAQLSFWHMLLPALGLHGLLLAYPIETKSDLDAALPKPGKPVRVITLPSTPPASGIKKNAASKPVNPVSKVQRPSLLQPRRAVVQNIVVAPPKTVTAAPQPSALASKPQPSPTPSATPTPTSSTPTNELQMEGAAPGCTASTIQDCFALTESDGRLVANRLEENLNQKGYDLSPLDLEEENGMKVYQLSKRGQPKQERPNDYLHVFWDENGTVYFRNPTILSYAELAAKAR